MKKQLWLGVTLLLVGCNSVAGTPTVEPVDNSTATQVEEEVEVEPTEEVVVEVAETEAPATATDAPEPTATEAEVATATEEVETEVADLPHGELLNELLFTDAPARFEEALIIIRDSGDQRFVAGLVDVMRYQRNMQDELSFALSTLTGADIVNGDWFTWVEWAGNHPEIESFEGYPGWKANLFAQIDPAFLRFVYQDVSVDPDSRVEEIVWGGVRVDGIPALDNPEMISPEEASYLEADERVFGVSINGDTRAYPARFLDWHEMFNDVVGGEPVSLAY